MAAMFGLNMLRIAALILSLLLAWAVGPEYLMVAMSRLLTPFEGQAWPKRTMIEVISPTPNRIAAETRHWSRH